MCHVGIYPNEPHVTVLDMFESSTKYLDFLIILCTIFVYSWRIHKDPTMFEFLETDEILTMRARLVPPLPEFLLALFIHMHTVRLK